MKLTILLFYINYIYLFIDIVLSTTVFFLYGYRKPIPFTYICIYKCIYFYMGI